MLDTELARDPGVCAHVDVEPRQVPLTFFKREFTAEVEVCRSCGEQWWTPEARGRFNAWVVELRRERRDVFQLQFYLPENSRHGLAELLAHYPGATPSGLIRVLTSVYLALHARLPHRIEELATLRARPMYLKSTFGRRRKTSVQFSPTALLDLQAWARRLNTVPHRIVEDAIFTSVALSAEPDRAWREFWLREVLPHVQAFLRAV